MYKLIANALFLKNAPRDSFFFITQIISNPCFKQLCMFFILRTYVRRHTSMISCYPTQAKTIKLCVCTISGRARRMHINEASRLL